MLNIEKYENKLREYGTDFALTKEGKLVNCKGFSCSNCAFNYDCRVKQMNWLLEENKESVLTDTEKAYLKSTITHLKMDDYLISKQERGSSAYICIAKVCGGYRYDVVLKLDLNYFKFNFNNMADDCWYKLEELGL